MTPLYIRWVLGEGGATCWPWPTIVLSRIMEREDISLSSPLSIITK